MNRKMSEMRQKLQINSLINRICGAVGILMVINAGLFYNYRHEFPRATL